MRSLLTPLALTLLVLGGCADQAQDATGPLEVTAPVFNTPMVAAAATFHAHAKGSEEVPAVDTRAQGQATFRLSRDGSSVDFKLNVSNIEDVLMAHIHLAPAGSNGGVVVWLYPAGPPPQLIPGRHQGELAAGAITADDLVGSLAGASLGDLIEVMRDGGAYVNVHTSANPGGEVRGQIR
jgi:hypothetical protein